MVLYSESPRKESLDPALRISTDRHTPVLRLISHQLFPSRRSPLDLSHRNVRARATESLSLRLCITETGPYAFHDQAALELGRNRRNRATLARDERVLT